MTEELTQENIDIIIQFMKSRFEWEYFVKNQLKSIKPNKIKKFKQNETKNQDKEI